MRNIKQIVKIIYNKDYAKSNSIELGWLGTTFKIIILILKNFKNERTKKGVISLPLTNNPQLILPLEYNTNIKECFNYIGIYSSINLRLIMKLINTFGLPFNKYPKFFSHKYDYKFVINTHEKLIVFKENKDSIDVIKYSVKNDVESPIVEKFIDGNMFCNKDHLKILLKYFDQKLPIKSCMALNNFFNLILEDLRFSNINLETKIDRFVGFQEHGDFVISNLRIRDDKIITLDNEKSKIDGFYFTDLSTFIFSYLSGEPNFNLIYLVKLNYNIKMKWISNIINHLSKKFEISNNDVRILLYLGLKRKTYLEKNKTNNYRFWNSITLFYKNKLLKEYND